MSLKVVMAVFPLNDIFFETPCIFIILGIFVFICQAECVLDTAFHHEVSLSKLNKQGVAAPQLQIYKYGILTRPQKSLVFAALSLTVCYLNIVFWVGLWSGDGGTGRWQQYLIVNITHQISAEELSRAANEPSRSFQRAWSRPLLGSSPCWKRLY